MDQNEPQVLQLDLLNDNKYGLVTYELTKEWFDEEKRREEDCKDLTFRIKRTKELKEIARNGLSNSVRRRYWFILSGGYDLFVSDGSIFEKALEETQKCPITEKSGFGVSFNYFDFIPPQIVPVLPTFLHTLWYHNKDIEYSPMIPAITTMLLMYMEPPLAYLSIQAIINKSRQSLFYILLNKSQLFAATESVEKLIISRLSNVAAHSQKLGINLPQLIISIFPSFFIPFISYPTSLTFFDSFISEGRKVFFRFILQIMFDEKKNLLNTDDSTEFGRIIFNAIGRLNNPEIMSVFIKKAFKIKLKRKNIFRKLEKMSSEIPNPEEIQLNFSQLHEMLPPSSFAGAAKHRRTRTLDSKAKKAFKLLNLNDIQQANTPLAINNSLESIESGEKILNQNNVENNTIQSSNSGKIKTNENNDLSTNQHSENSKNDQESNSVEIDLKLTSTMNENNSNDFISEHEVQKKRKGPSVFKPEEDDFDSVKDIQAKIAQQWLPSVYTHSAQNLVFTDQMLLLIRNKLPPVFRLYSADLVFKLSENGSNFHALFARCSSRWQYIMIIKTSSKIVGAFLSDPLIPKPFGRYYGTGMTFVFDLTKNDFFKVKKPVNQYYLSVSEDTIMIGGPDPAFFIQNGFELLRSNYCETFNSPILTENKNGDHIVDFEVFRFIPLHFIQQRRKSISSIQNLA